MKPTNPIPFDPLNGCPHCKWLNTNLGRQLDEKCDLHLRIEELQQDYAIERMINRANNDTYREIIEALSGGDDDDPVKLAKQRMEELREFEDEAREAENAEPWL
jgi:hypothetical protein